MNEFSPLDTFTHTLRRWPLVVLLMLIGGGLGWLYHRFQPPLYEATAEFTVSVDFSRADAISRWDEDRYEEDHMIGAAKSLMASTAVVEQVAADVQALGIPPEALTYGRYVFIERKQAVMVLRVRHHDPRLAAAIANHWAQRAYQALSEAQAHAQRAWALRQYLAGLNNCLQTPQPEAGSLCARASLAEVQQALETAQTELGAETLASKGIVPALVFDWSRQAATPDEAVAFAAKWLVLGGALIGLAVGVALATVRPAGRRC